MHGQVLRVDEPGRNPLLSVQRVWTEAAEPLQCALENAAEAAPTIPYMGSVHMEEHLIPFVPDVVVKVDRKAQVLTIDPPHGLLEIGRQRRLIRLLEPELAVRLPDPIRAQQDTLHLAQHMVKRL